MQLRVHLCARTHCRGVRGGDLARVLACWCCMPVHTCARAFLCAQVHP